MEWSEFMESALEEEWTKLQEEVQMVKERIQILDLIEKKLFRMREISQSVVKGGLNPLQIKEIQKEMKNLTEQINLLNLPGNLQS